MVRPLISAALMIMGLGACTPLQLLDALSPRGGYAAASTQAYGPDARQQIDIYQPKEALVAGARRPVVVFFYGGRWTYFNKREFRFVGDALASRGYLVLLPDYRVYPAVKFPVFVDDAALAVRWAHDHAAEWGGDPNRIVLAGHSAGAHIAAEVALDQRYLQKVGVPPHAIRGLVGMSGPYDFLPFTDPAIKDLMGPEAGFPDTQPIQFVDATDPPMLLQYGLKDELVWPHNARNLQDKARKAGVRAELKEYEGLDHYGPIAALAAPLHLLAPVFEDLATFVDDVTH